MEQSEAAQSVAFPIPHDWRRYPELIPALRILVEGARRAAIASGPQPPPRSTSAHS